MMDKTEKAPVIVFDYGGVLIDYNLGYLFLKLVRDQEAIDRFLQEVDFFTWNREQDRGRTFAEGTAELVARFPHYRELILAYDRRFEETISGPIQPVVEILSRLKQAGYPLYGLSNWPAEKFALVRPRYPFFDLFDGMVVSGEVGLIKPEPEIYRVLLERAGRAAEDCLFIDDNQENIATARQLGFQTILFRSPQQLEDELHCRGILWNGSEKG